MRRKRMSVKMILRTTSQKMCKLLKSKKRFHTWRSNTSRRNKQLRTI